MNVPRHTGTQRSLRETLLLAKLSHKKSLSKCIKAFLCILPITYGIQFTMIPYQVYIYICVYSLCYYNLIYSALPCSVSVQDQQLKAATRLERKCQWQIQLLPIVGRHSRLQRALRCSDTTKRHKGKVQRYISMCIYIQYIYDY